MTGVGRMIDNYTLNISRQLTVTAVDLSLKVLIKVLTGGFNYKGTVKL
jgi:hypothetical protein